MSEPTFTIQQIKNYLIKEDSFGDALYHLNAENILKANEEDVEADSDDL